MDIITNIVFFFIKSIEYLNFRHFFGQLDCFTKKSLLRYYYSSKLFSAGFFDWFIVGIRLDSIAENLVS
jgi:hypothetical protein